MQQLLVDSLAAESLAPALTDDICRRLARTVLDPPAGMTVFPRSICAVHHRLYFMGLREDARFVGIIAKSVPRIPIADAFRSVSIADTTLKLAVMPADARAADMLKMDLPFLRPRKIGGGPSIGCGDRLGLATPGHVRALAKTRLGAVLCQQSVRENSRTGRSPRQVLDDAMWGTWQEGWRNGFGADADHVKTPADIAPFVDAGYTFFTVDVGDHLNAGADTADAAAVETKVSALPWEKLRSTPSDLVEQLARRPIELDGFTLSLTGSEVLRAAAKYGAAVAWALKMFEHLCGVMDRGTFEFEVSVDETATATTVAEHIYLAHEISRLGIACTSLAPRFVGAFEKGVDFIGDLATFEDAYRRHAAVARTFGNYKLSLHSGSDKFSIYPIAARHSKGAVHLKTAGTSYLEALRTIAASVPELFREIMAYGISRYAEDRVSYHVSADPARLPDVHRLADGDLPDVLNDFHAREVLHVTYGSVLNHPELRRGLFDALHRHREAYEAGLERHFDRHCAPF